MGLGAQAQDTVTTHWTQAGVLTGLWVPRAPEAERSPLVPAWVCLLRVLGWGFLCCGRLSPQPFALASPWSWESLTSSRLDFSGLGPRLAPWRLQGVFLSLGGDPRSGLVAGLQGPLSRKHRQCPCGARKQRSPVRFTGREISCSPRKEEKEEPRSGGPGCSVPAWTSASHRPEPKA